jgi:hypothetical protein
MKISLSSAAAATSLAEYLESCGCIVARLNLRAIEAAPPPRSLEADLAQLEIEAYVRVWHELNAPVEMEVIPEESGSRLYETR